MQVTTNDIKAAIDQFEDQTHVKLWCGITESSFGTGLSAVKALCEHIASEVNKKLVEQS